jgi:hypothetical protein
MHKLTNPFTAASNPHKMLRPLPLCLLFCRLLCLLFAPAFTTLAQTNPPAHSTAVAHTSPTQQAAYNNARQSLKERRYAEAFGRFAELADQGHVASARMALALYDHGPAWPTRSDRTAPGQQRRWYAMSQLLNEARSFAPDTEARD